jgi:hypothetical protein
MSVWPPMMDQLRHTGYSEEDGVGSVAVEDVSLSLANSVVRHDARPMLVTLQQL